jgi:hypothetical protein
MFKYFAFVPLERHYFKKRYIAHKCICAIAAGVPKMGCSEFEGKNATFDMSDTHEQQFPLPYCCEIRNLQICRFFVDSKATKKYSFFLWFKLKAVMSYFVHLALCGAEFVVVATKGIGLEIPLFLPTKRTFFPRKM